jgi:hypothetical protein
VFTRQKAKLIESYRAYIAEKQVDSKVNENAKNLTDINLDIVTDDEAIVLYYILSNRSRKIKKFEIMDWIAENEIFDVNIDNAFDLLSIIGDGKFTGYELEFDTITYKSYLKNINVLLPQLQVYVGKHRILRKDTFLNLWELEIFSDLIKLFISFVIEKRVISYTIIESPNVFERPIIIDSIHEWETENGLGDNILLSNYETCVYTLSRYELVYESDVYPWGKEYTLYPSLAEYLFSPQFPYAEELNVIKNKYEAPLSF